MNYPERTIYSAIEQRINDNAVWLTDNNAKAVSDIQWYNNQYENPTTDLPFARPAVFIEFGSMTWEHHTAFTKKSKVPIALHIAQDLYVDGRSGSPQHDEFKALLDYPYLINELFDGWNGGASCFKSMNLTASRTDHDNDNLMVHVFTYEAQVVLSKSGLAPG